MGRVTIGPNARTRSRMGGSPASGGPPPPSGYTADWSTAWGPEWTQVDASGTGSLTVSGGNGNVNSGAALNNATYARLEAPTFADFDMLVGVGASTTNRQGRVIFRWDGTTAGSNPDNCYVLLHRHGTSSFGFQLYRIASGTATRIDAGTNDSTADPLYIRIEASGSTIRWKSWLQASPEPGTWTVSVTDATHATGKVGIGVLKSSGSGAQTETYTDLTIST